MFVPIMCFLFFNKTCSLNSQIIIIIIKKTKHNKLNTEKLPCLYPVHSFSYFAFILFCPLPISFILSHHIVFLFLSHFLFSLAPGRHGDSAFPQPATRIPIRLTALTNTRTHAHIASVWQCQGPDESNDRLTSVYRPQLTSP